MLCGRPLKIMVKDSSDLLNRTFAALSDPTRRSILARLRNGSLRITEVAGPLPMSLAAASRHIRVLEQAGLISRTVRGREHWLTLSTGSLRPAADWIASHQMFWEANLNLLTAQLGEPSDID